MAVKYVKIELKNEDGKVVNTAECMPQSVKLWEKRGWTVVGDSEQEEKPEAPQAEATKPQARRTPDPKTTGTAAGPAEKENA